MGRRRGRLSQTMEPSCHLERFEKRSMKVLSSEGRQECSAHSSSIRSVTFKASLGQASDAHTPTPLVLCTPSQHLSDDDDGTSPSKRGRHPHHRPVPIKPSRTLVRSGRSARLLAVGALSQEPITRHSSLSISSVAAPRPSPASSASPSRRQSTPARCRPSPRLRPPAAPAPPAGHPRSRPTRR